MPTKFSRPGRRPLFGKRTEVMKTLVDPETKEIHEARARALGYTTLSEYLADKLMVDAHGLETVTSLQTDRLRRVATIGPVKDPEGEA